MTETTDTSTLISRNIVIAGRRTSIRLEPELWDALRLVSRMEGKTLNTLCTTIARHQRHGGFTSAVRVYIVRYLLGRYLVARTAVNTPQGMGAAA
jgi:predicted DNA-binding ribbon-helix-helix protein